MSGGSEPQVPIPESSFDRLKPGKNVHLLKVIPVGIRGVLNTEGHHRFSVACRCRYTMSPLWAPSVPWEGQSGSRMPGESGASEPVKGIETWPEVAMARPRPALDCPKANIRVNAVCPA